MEAGSRFGIIGVRGLLRDGGRVRNEAAVRHPARVRDGVRVTHRFSEHCHRATT